MGFKSLVIDFDDELMFKTVRYEQLREGTFELLLKEDYNRSKMYPQRTKEERKKSEHERHPAPPPRQHQDCSNTDERVLVRMSRQDDGCPSW
jgi:hypothetical protein